MYFILDLDDTLAHTTRDLRGDKTRLPHLLLVAGARKFIAAHGKDSILISAAADFEYQKQKIEHLKLNEAFEEIILVPSPEEKEAAIRKAVLDFAVPAKEVAVVGDRLEHEIRAANALGLVTVRMRLPEGKYSSLEPAGAAEKPAYEAKDFFELMKLPFLA